VAYQLGSIGVLCALTLNIAGHCRPLCASANHRRWRAVDERSRQTVARASPAGDRTMLAALPVQYMRLRMLWYHTFGIGIEHLGSEPCQTPVFCLRSLPAAKPGYHQSMSCLRDGNFQCYIVLSCVLHSLVCENTAGYSCKRLRCSAQCRGACDLKTGSIPPRFSQHPSLIIPSTSRSSYRLAAPSAPIPSSCHRRFACSRSRSLLPSKPRQ